MKKIINFLIILLFLLITSCATDCSKCAVVVKPKIMIPNVDKCPVPKSIEDIRKELKSVYYPQEITSETQLYDIIVFNSKTHEMYLMKWQEYYNCVNKLIKEKQRLKENLEKTSK